MTLGLVASLLLAQSVTVEGDLTVLAPYYAYLPYARISVIRGWAAGGVSVQTSRAESDPNADLDIWHANRTAGQAWRASKGTGVVVGQLEWNGQLTAGGQDAPAAFMSQGGASLACQPGAWGCYTTVYGGMTNKGFHGAVTLGNRFGNPDRDGGLGLQVLGLGKTHSYDHTVLAQDVYGNLTTYGGLMGNFLDPQDFDTCRGPHGFDNPGPALDSPGGVMRPLGMWGYATDKAALQVCTTRSAAQDGGYEVVCTDKNGVCLPANLKFTTNNDALYITENLNDGGSRTAVIPWSYP